MSLFRIFRLKKRANLSASKLEVVKTTFFQDSIPMLVAAILMILSAALRGVNLLLAFSSFMVGFLLLDYFSGPRNLRKLVAKRRLPSSIYAGEPFYVEIELDSKERRVPSWGVVVQDEWEEEDPRFQDPHEAKERALLEESQKGDKKLKKKSVAHESASDKKDTASFAAETRGAETLRPVVYFPQIGANKTAKAFYAGVMANRGPRRTASLTLSTRFPLGFFRSLRRDAAADEILVFPRLGRVTDEWRAYAGRECQEAETTRNAVSRAPDETVAIRDWRPGDTSRMIAWRATAKRQRLQTREFAKRQTSSVAIILDLYAPRYAERREELYETVEKAISFVATLSRNRSTNDTRLYFALNAEEVSADAKETSGACEVNEIVSGGSARRILSRLAVATPTGSDRFADVLRAAMGRAPRDAAFFVVTLGARDEEERKVFNEGATLRVVDASSDAFDRYFQYSTTAEEGDAAPSLT
ncbi:MAG: DUF58 domain-containing protein [Thermoguttaceae bacterium]